MATPEADERAYWLSKLGIADDPTLSLADLRNRTAGAVHVNKSAEAGGSGVAYMTQAQGDARYPLLANAIPLSSTSPSKDAQTAFAGSEGAAAHGDHVHPMHAMAPGLLYHTTGKISANRTTSNTATNGLNKLYLTPYPIIPYDFRNLTLTGVTVRVGTAVAASNVRVGLYKALPTGKIDWTQLVFDISLATTAVGDVTGALANIVIPPGLYWAGGVQQGGIATCDAAVSSIPVYNPDDGSARTPQSVAVNTITGALPTTAQGETAGNEPAINIFLSLA